MKTEFNTEEDEKFLEELLWRGIGSTESLIFYKPNTLLSDYIFLLIKFRRKCFEYLEERDPNEDHICNIEKEIRERNFEEVKKMDIKVPEFSY